MSAGRIETLEMDKNEFEATLARMKKQLPAKDYEWIEKLARAYRTLTGLVEDKRMSIQRLRQLLFGSKTEKTRTVLEQAGLPGPEEDGDDDDEPPGGSRRSGAKGTPRKGHGRNGAAAYRGAERIAVPHETLKPGDPCPECPKGKVYRMAEPGLLIRMTAQAPIQAKVYELEKFRCNLCGTIFTARSPDGVGESKYTAASGSMMGIFRYGSGQPLNRQAWLEGLFGIPLPASTQWRIIKGQVHPAVKPVARELARQAARGTILHNDDTHARILAWMGKRRPKPEDMKPEDRPDRMGLYTSAIVSCTPQGREISLFYTGRKHAGENLEAVLADRPKELGPPLQMSDGLSHNVCGDFESIQANCLAHSRRRYVEILGSFPSECRHVLQVFRKVYKNDARAKRRGMSDEQRLRFHQKKSGPLLEGLQQWFHEQFEKKRIEPNSLLGDAIEYMTERWDKLTCFLHVPGAPLDNSLCERTLKMAIRHRRNSLFYKTDNGARVGDDFMTVIHTCARNGVGAFDYLTTIQLHAADVAAHPERWLPWNYQDALPRAASA